MAAETQPVETAHAAGCPPRSAAQAAAARANGKRSRGPRSVAGKAAASRNALKHGFFAAVHLVLPGEDAESFSEMRRALARERGVEGLAEETLAHTMATATLQQLRLERMQRDLCAAYATTPMGPLADAEGRQQVALMLRWQARVETQQHRASAELRRCQKERAAATGRFADELRDACERNAELYRDRIARLERELGRAAAAVTVVAEVPVGGTPEAPALRVGPKGPELRNEPEPPPERSRPQPVAAVRAAAPLASRLRRKLMGEEVDDEEELMVG